MFVVGLTGGIGSGKTTAANLFADLGINLLDTDHIARELVQPNTPALANIIDYFGQTIVDDTGQLKRQELGKIIFSNADKRRWLENLLHPLIDQILRLKLKSLTSAYAMIVSPLLLETDQKKLVNRILLIDCPQSIQEQRVMARNHYNLATIRHIIAAQLPAEKKRQLADDIVTNDKSKAYLSTQILYLHHHYLKLASNPH